SLSNGEATGGVVVVTPPGTGVFYTYTYNMSEGIPWTIAKLNATSVFVNSRFAGGGGATRSIDIDHIRVVYDPCIVPTTTVTQSYTSSPTASNTPLFSATPTMTPV